jgi:hypothetical protein
MNHQFKSTFQYSGVILLIVALLLVNCQSEAATAVPPTDIPPTPVPEDDGIASAEAMAGIWKGTVAGEWAYFLYTEDGRYTLALTQDDLGTAPRVSGEYWFEDGALHLRDLENAGHWVVCDAATIGIYEVVVLENGNLQFQTVEDGCDVGGFTRNYIFANMTLERIVDPDGS